MKWLLGGFLIWLVVKGEFGDYAALVAPIAPKGSATIDTSTVINTLLNGG